MKNHTPIIIVVLLGIVIVVLLAAYIYFPAPTSQKNNPTPGTSVTPGPITVRGEIDCLPHRATNGGAETAECAIGLKADDGKFYGLLNLNQQDLVSGKWSPGTRVVVSGDLAAAPESNYAVVGNISVKSIAPAAGQ